MQKLASLQIFKLNNSLEIVIDSNARSSQCALQQEAVSAIDVVIVTNLGKTEGCREFFGGLPCNTGLEHHCIITLRCIQQREIACQIDKQGEFVTNCATHVTYVWLKVQHIGSITTTGSHSIIDTESHLPLIVDAITHFWGKFNRCQTFLSTCTKTAANPNLGIGRHNSCKNDCEN